MKKTKSKELGAKHLNPIGLCFSLFTKEEIEKLSAKKITLSASFNSLGHPLVNGLYDPALGPVGESRDLCSTCSNTILSCPGHLGHIELPLPVVNPLFHQTIYSVLRFACLKCYTIQLKGYEKLAFISKLRLLENGLISVQEIDDIVAEFLMKHSKNGIGSVEESSLQEKLEAHYENVMAGDCAVLQTCLNTTFVESLINDVRAAMDKKVLDIKVCLKCQLPFKKLRYYQQQLITTVFKEGEGEDGGKMVSTVILPIESKDHLRNLWNNEQNFIKAFVPVLKSCDMEYPTDIFFCTFFPVLPPKMRPVQFVLSKVVEHPQSLAFKAILQNCIIIESILLAIKAGNTNNISEECKGYIKSVSGSTLDEKLNTSWGDLQIKVDNLLDNRMDCNSSAGLCLGIKQIIEKKTGIIRMHMMGKRVNYAARSVITPDPYLSINEIGVPEIFAKHLTYPVPVTEWNVTSLRNMVLNGPNKYPGAVAVVNEDGSITKISATNPAQRKSVSKCLLLREEKSHLFTGIKVVHRHLTNGDILLLNRQPTLHRPSIMAHIVRVLKGDKAFRLHYANCKAYNADFDGDEMNAHFPQNEIARSEAYNLLNVKYQYLVPRDGTPLTGLIQDHVIAGVQLSLRGRCFERDDYQQLVFQALGHQFREIKLLPPSILKPVSLWSGKQIISTVIINVVPVGRHAITLNSKSKVSDKTWVSEEPRDWKGGGTPFENPSFMTETEVIIRNGELLCGILDKNQYGATPYGLVHCMFELYGGTCSSKLLNTFTSLFNAYLHREGFTLGVEDILVTKRSEDERTHLITNARKVGDRVIQTALNLSEEAEMLEKMEEVYENKARGRAFIDGEYKAVLDKVTNKINKACVPNGLYKRFPANNLQLMILSGAKGSAVNAMQISCLLGQIELEGKRPLHMISGKSLPSFARYDTSPRAGGYVDGRFMTGIKPQEFYYHCMAGREGLIDTAVKTSRSGYLQRCLVKHLEGLVVAYDMTVRDSDGSVIQFCYGEDGRDVTKSQFLNKEQMPFLEQNVSAIKSFLVENLEDAETTVSISQRKRDIREWKKNYGNPLHQRRLSPFTMFSNDMRKSKVSKFKKILNKKTGRSKITEEIVKLWVDSDIDLKESYKDKALRCPDPVTADFQVDRDFGAITEQLEKLMDDYLKHRSKDIRKEFSEMMFVKSVLSQAHPGEPVGLLAAQSLGEPSTQMTLNTFHFAGHGEMNVTLGIPRLRELLLTATKDIKTPNMDVPFSSEVQRSEIGLVP